MRLTLPETGTVLELASGTGQHAVYFAACLPDLVWQPSDREPEARASIRARSSEAALANLREPIEVDVTWPSWPIVAADAVVAINMLHISPWEACRGLFEGAARCLRPGAAVFCYGAFLRRDRETAPSNLEFDRWLREQDERWGVRQLEAVIEVAQQSGLVFDRVLDMPNNNYSLVHRQPSAVD